MQVPDLADPHPTKTFSSPPASIHSPALSSMLSCCNFKTIQSKQYQAPHLPAPPQPLAITLRFSRIHASKWTPCTAHWFLQAIAALSLISDAVRQKVVEISLRVCTLHTGSKNGRTVTGFLMPSVCFGAYCCLVFEMQNALLSPEDAVKRNQRCDGLSSVTFAVCGGYKYPSLFPSQLSPLLTTIIFNTYHLAIHSTTNPPSTRMDPISQAATLLSNPPTSYTLPQRHLLESATQAILTQFLPYGLSPIHLRILLITNTLSGSSLHHIKQQALQIIQTRDTSAYTSSDRGLISEAARQITQVASQLGVEDIAIQGSREERMILMADGKLNHAPQSNIGPSRMNGQSTSQRAASVVSGVSRVSGFSSLSRLNIPDDVAEMTEEQGRRVAELMRRHPQFFTAGQGTPPQPTQQPPQHQPCLLSNQQNTPSQQTPPISNYTPPPITRQQFLTPGQQAPPQQQPPSNQLQRLPQLPTLPRYSDLQDDMLPTTSSGIQMEIDARIRDHAAMLEFLVRNDGVLWKLNAKEHRIDRQP